MKDLINTTTFLWIIFPLLMSFGITLQSRYAGRDFEKCENWNQRIQLWVCILFATIINYILLILMMGIIYLTYK